MAPADDALIAEYLKGDLLAFERLYDRYASRLLGFVLSLGGQRDTCEDVAQQAWIKVLDGLPAYRSQGQFRAWLFRIAYRLWLDEVRSAWQSRRVSIEKGDEEEFTGLPIERELADPAAGPEEEAKFREDCERLYRALEELPDRMRQTILLRIDGELTFRGIAETMQCPLGTVLWRAKEAERRLRARLSPREVEQGR